MKDKGTLSILLPALLLFACGSPPAEAPEENRDLITITKSQFSAEQMAFGEPVHLPFNQLVHFTGAIIPAANAKAQVSLPVAGIVRRILCQPGQAVQQGRALLEVGGNEFIDMQKELSISGARMKQARADWDRMRQLYGENIGTQKEYTHAESAYQTEKATYEALRLKLSGLGLNIRDIEEGKFTATYTLPAPIGGHITRIEATVGQYIESQAPVAEIVNPGQSLLKLRVYEKDIARVKPAQRVLFRIPGTDSVTYGASVEQVGKVVGEDSKAIDCYARIDPEPALHPVSLQFVDGDIITGSDSAWALPLTSVLKSENHHYLLDLVKEDAENFYFRKVEIQPGRQNGDLVEITGKPEVKKPLVKGVYNVQP